MEAKPCAPVVEDDDPIAELRMQAELNRVELTGEWPIPRQRMHIGNARTGSYGPSSPRGVNQNKSSVVDRSDAEDTER